MVESLIFSQIFEWWYFRKYGTSFIEQVTVGTSVLLLSFSLSFSFSFPFSFSYSFSITFISIFLVSNIINQIRVTSHGFVRIVQLIFPYAIVCMPTRCRWTTSRLWLVEMSQRLRALRAASEGQQPIAQRIPMVRIEGALEGQQPIAYRLSMVRIIGLIANTVWIPMVSK